MAAKDSTRGILSAEELSAFCAQLALITKAGIPAQEGISIMMEDSGSVRTRELLQTILDKLEEGAPLKTGLAQTQRFPKYMLDMVGIGEQSGRLDEVLDSLSAYYERSQSISRSIKSAVTYPAVMIAMMAVIIGILICSVLPIFQQVFRQLGSEMSAFAQGIMAFGAGLSRYSALIVGAILALIAAWVILRRSAGGREFLSHCYSSFFGTRRIAAKVAAGRFASAMSMMLSSGLDVDQSLDMAANLIDDAQTREKIQQMKQKMADGASFAEALMATQLFSGVYARMITVGFKTGAADGVMKKIAERYEEEIDDTIGKLLGVLEPTLVAVLSIIVGMILLSVMLPLMGIMSSIG
ncbi:MAG: type II secretion system F family protein [Oscillospiraceae bacterium]|nr:type II secretion system F family protein [Oscillospiraceae bacterium]